MEGKMAADPKEGDNPLVGSDERDEEGFLGATRDLAAFARKQGFSRADTLLTELLAIIYARKS